MTVHQSLEQTRAGGARFKSPKTKRARRTIALPQILVAALQEHLNRQQRNRESFGNDYPPHDLVILLADGTPWPPDRFTDAYVAFTRRIGAEGIRFHDLRHTHASELLRRGMPIKTVSQRLGHKDASVTLNVYAHVMSGDDERAADVVDDVMRKQMKSQSMGKAN
ncbi:MAG: site-specific integrase [Acidobacteriaceae bacterium]|nr:site-specific integrase [Acidobacteriaceae bacterium]